jgi:heat shock protein HtpX
MRIVLTQGILDLLEEEEVEAVIGHEIGHGVHWDMAVMTMAQLVPLVLYYIYRMARSTEAKKKAAAVKFAVMIGAYVLYVIS